MTTNCPILRKSNLHEEKYGQIELGHWMLPHGSVLVLSNNMKVIISRSLMLAVALRQRDTACFLRVSEKRVWSQAA
jgi:hypothetical protein